MTLHAFWLLSIFGPWLVAGIVGAVGFHLAARRQNRRTLPAQIADDYLAHIRRGMGA